MSSSAPRPRRRALATASSVLLAAVLAFAGLAALSSGPAAGGPVKGSLDLVSVSDDGTGLAGMVAGRPFSVTVRAYDEAGLPLLVSKDTTVTLSEVSGPGELSGNTTGVIAKNTSEATISGAVYSAFGNGIVLAVSVTGNGVSLLPDQATTNAALTAVKAVASPRAALDVTDPGCAGPTPDNPICGFLLLPNGANGTILLSVGACDGILACLGGSTATPGLVSASLSLKDEVGNPLYTKTAPATFVIACDKTRCGNGGAASFVPVIDLLDDGNFAPAPPCPAKGVLGADQSFCLDTVQTKRDNAGDTYSFVLFDVDIRGSMP